MSENLVYNVVTVIFLTLTIIILVMVVGVATEAMTPPSFLAPEEPEPTPTRFIAPTFEPSAVPGAELTPEVTLTPEGQ